MASQAAGEGISLFVSSGDAGAAGCDANNSLPPVDQIKSPNYLCSTSYITCVGGTEFNDTANPTQYWTTSTNPAVASALGYIPEGGWNEPTTDSSGAIAYQASASAGGVSSLIAKPSWQTGPGVPADGFRDTPDMAFPSAAHEAYYACYAANGGDCSKGYFEYFYGTSCAAPSMAGVTALIDQKLGGAQGNLNPKLYSVAASTAFHDTTVATSGVSGCSLATPSMCNNSTPSPTSLTGGLAGYEVGTGYDQVTGLGSLDVDKLIVALSPPLPVPTVALTSNPTTITTSQTAVLTAAVSGAGATPTGTVQFSSNGVNLGAAVALTSGTATSPAEPFTTAGTYKITAQYSGDSNYQPATSEVTSLTVTAPGPPPTYTITAPPLIITAPGAITGNTSTITLTAQNGFVGTIAVTCAVAYQGTGTANDPPTCTLSSSGSVALSSTTTSATLTATFATTAPSGAGKVALLQHPANPKQRHPWPTPGEGALLACLVLLPFGLRSKFLRGKAPTLKTAALLFLVCAAGLATGCGGSSNPPPVTNPGTSTGAYTVTLTGTSGSTTITTTVTLTVQ